MKFKIDENLPAEIAVDLRAAGHQADTVSDEGLTGAVDPAILAREPKTQINRTPAEPFKIISKSTATVTSPIRSA